METKYESVKKEEKIAKLNQTKELQESKLKIEKTQRIILIAGMIFMLILLVVIFKSYSQKKKSNIEIQKQRDEANKQKAIVEEKNSDILESITYAKRIQEAILPANSIINNYLKEYFILYKPKDIVSGDFYWFHTIDDNNILFSVIDCTGHGVPGAFMSIVGNNSLNKAVQEQNLIIPSQILTSLNKTVIDIVKQGDRNVEDGMDLALCNLNLSSLVLQYAGAYNPLYIIREKELIEIKADRYSIGNMDSVFKNHEIQLQSGDSIYIFSDGYSDQFGGEEDKKYSAKRLKELFIRISFEPMEKQETILLDEFNNWKSNQDQLDDICIMGIKIP